MFQSVLVCLSARQKRSRVAVERQSTVEDSYKLFGWTGLSVNWMKGALDESIKIRTEFCNCTVFSLHFAASSCRRH